MRKDKVKGGEEFKELQEFKEFKNSAPGLAGAEIRTHAGVTAPSKRWSSALSP